ncbi:hypothetical protein [Actinomadura sp. 21ATH]|uniref:hypothetical protein n=1 Tax=Actinomadura sp. 21ATH TaxID=1735444 RepID=UPI0035C20F50
MTASREVLDSTGASVVVAATARRRRRLRRAGYAVGTVCAAYTMLLGIGLTGGVAPRTLAWLPGISDEKRGTAEIRPARIVQSPEGEYVPPRPSPIPAPVIPRDGRPSKPPHPRTFPAPAETTKPPAVHPPQDPAPPPDDAARKPEDPAPQPDPTPEQPPARKRPPLLPGLGGVVDLLSVPNSPPPAGASPINPRSR